MRRLIYSLMNADPVGPMVPGGIFGDGSLEAPLERPFMNLTYRGPTPGLGRIRQMRAIVHVHDDIGDYTRIDDTLKVVRDVLLAAPVKTLNGVYLLDVQWEGDSDDLLDPERGTNMKNSTYLLTASGL